MTDGTTRAGNGGWTDSRTVGGGIRASMYGEMAAAAAGNRPGWVDNTPWDAAFVAAIRFLDTSGFDERTRQVLLDETAELWMAKDRDDWDVASAEVCSRLACEFHQQAVHR